VKTSYVLGSNAKTETTTYLREKDFGEQSGYKHNSKWLINNQ